jgi:hypothetical protein
VKKLFVLVAIGLLILVAGCDTLNIGGTGTPNRGPQVTMATPTTGLEGMGTTTFTAAWSGGTAPYTIAWNFGGGATNIPAAAATSPASANATWADSATPNNYTVTATVTDANGNPGTASVTVTVIETQNAVPTIDSVTVAGNVLTVTASDADNDTVAITVSGFTGMTVDNATKNAAATGSAAFTFTSENIFAAATSGVTVTADDGNGGMATDTSATISIPAIVLNADTLYAIPQETSVNTGDPVTVLVATGATGSGFQFMTGVGLVMPDDGSYVSNSFNVGAPGGAKDDADGAWAPITSNGGFLLGPDGLIQAGPNPDATLAAGTQRFDFNITPLGGSDVASAEGILFNAQFSFSAAGSKTFTFQQFNGVNRTYYSDVANGVDTFWGSFVDGTVTVN